MNIQYLTIAVLLMVFSNGGLASIPFNEFEPYTWEEERERTTLTEEQRALPELILYSGQHLHYVMGDQGAFQYITTHYKIYLNSEEAIQRNNRIEIGMENLIDIVDIRARTFTSDGRILELDQESVREINDEDVHFSRLFAIEGIDIGSEIEFFFTVKSALTLFGSHGLQFLAPCLKSEFTLTAPFYMRFDLKPYNADLKVDTLSAPDSISHKFRLIATDLPELRIEPFSNPLAQLISVHYRFVETILFPDLFKFNWDEAGRHFYKLVYEKSGRERRALRRFLRSFNPEGSLEDKVSKIEHYLKDNITFDMRVQAMGINELDWVLENKTAGSGGMIRLFAATLDHFGIRHEIVISSDRFEHQFDPYFETWHSLREYLIYLPELEKFIAPDYFAFRNFLIPYGYTHTYGLFIRRFKTPAKETGIAYTNWIPPFEYRTSKDILHIEVQLEENLSKAIVKEKRSFSGYNSLWIQPFADLLSESELFEIVEELTQSTAVDAEIGEWEVLNKGVKWVNWEPLQINVNYSSASYIQRAGNNYLFKLGNLIGQQLELYVERERHLPVENDFLRGYERKITVHIPENMQIANLEDIAIKEYFDYLGERVFSFESSYSFQDNVLEVSIYEYYNTIEIGPEDFEGFRKVINAAADFNKVTLLLRNN